MRTLHVVEIKSKIIQFFKEFSVWDTLKPFEEFGSEIHLAN